MADLYITETQTNKEETNRTTDLTLVMKHKENRELLFTILQHTAVLLSRKYLWDYNYYIN